MFGWSILESVGAVWLCPFFFVIMMQVFQQFIGINTIMFLFQTVGFKNGASLLSSVIIGLVNVLSTSVSIYAVDKVGRRKLLLLSLRQNVHQPGDVLLLILHPFS